MLAKLAGVALVLGSTTTVGWQVAARYANRPQHLRALQTALAVLQTEVEYGATPLPQALTAAAQAAGEPAGAIFRAAVRRLREGRGITPGEALAGALDETADGTALTKADRSVLLALAPALGSSGRSDQMRHLTLARERLAGQEAQAQAEQAKYERLARYMGVLSGAALVLIFL
ncbi:MAG TPA: stage III sporulation protein SpoIIIAB [Symbiobacteriaceae bacterium]